MTTHSKRVAAAALSVALGFGGAAAIAGTALAAPSATPSPSAKSTTSAKPTTSATPTQKPGTPTRRDGSATPTAAPTTPQVIKTELRDESGAPGSKPSYVRLYDSSTTLDSRGSLYTAAGVPLANRVVAIYDYSTGKRGAMLGAGKTNAQGKFAFSVPLPKGWSSNPNFNVQIAFDDEAGVYGSAALYLKVQSSGTATPTTSATPTKKPTSAPTKDTSGGLAKTGN